MSAMAAGPVTSRLGRLSHMACGAPSVRRGLETLPALARKAPHAVLHARAPACGKLSRGAGPSLGRSGGLWLSRRHGRTSGNGFIKYAHMGAMARRLVPS
ncbi:hypothetical protein GCM10007301_13610 [Azorhizobium oxalatiphilum]|uniref:Uncharacterized protein n=1 Tax=Azorhizobium oxalatiphilum TaxID=980631 RepID=A0A917BTF1_9HYPH|nr:hypothetical protein GCM10007301_13610 [Azorhizobium oxalatiphilum]